METITDDTRDDLLAAYLQHFPVLRAQLRKRLGSSDIVDDAMQETWLKVAGSRHSQVVQNKQAFLLRVASNIAIDILRRERRHRDRCSADPDLLDSIADLSPSPETIVVDRDCLKALVRTLLDLPPKCRAALLMSRCDGLPHREIARRLGVSESMIAKYLAEALRRCRGVLRAIS